jgi:hypothetical protein
MAIVKFVSLEKLLHVHADIACISDNSNLERTKLNQFEQIKNRWANYVSRKLLLEISAVFEAKRELYL